jgi:hypothetical protein
MAVIRNDNLDLKTPKPTRNTDIVGDNELSPGVYPDYVNKESIPAEYRYEHMRTIMNSGTDAGAQYELIGGIEDINWKKAVLGEQEALYVTWSELIRLHTEGNVSIWDRFYITDRNNRPLSVEQRDGMGELWYVWTGVAGAQILHKLPRNTYGISMDDLPPLLRSRLDNI